jgi:hypothetical protein
MVGGCGGTQFGCCGDTVTGREDEAGTNCSPEPIEPCAVVDRAACDGEDATVKGVSDACFAVGGQIAGEFAACGACDPTIEGPADVCVECQQAVFGAFAQCEPSFEVDEAAAAGSPTSTKVVNAGEFTRQYMNECPAGTTGAVRVFRQRFALEDDIKRPLLPSVHSAAGGRVHG